MADSDIPAEAVEAGTAEFMSRADGGPITTPRQHVVAILTAAVPSIRADERARVLAEVDAARRDRHRFNAWLRPQPQRPRRTADLCAEYLRDVLGAGGEQ